MVLGPKKTWRTRNAAPATSRRRSQADGRDSDQSASGSPSWRQVSWLRNTVDGERNLCPRSGIVRRLAGVDAAAESERVVEERLQNLRR